MEGILPDFGILLDDNDDLPIVTQHVRVDAMEMVAQRVRVRLKVGLGEWFLDETFGLPLVAWSQQKPPDVDGIGARIRREIESVPGVNEVRDFIGTYSIADRKFEFSCVVVVESEEDYQLTVTNTGSGSGSVNASPWSVVFFPSGGNVSPIVRGGV